MRKDHEVRRGEEGGEGSRLELFHKALEDSELVVFFTELKQVIMLPEEAMHCSGWQIKGKMLRGNIVELSKQEIEKDLPTTSPRNERVKVQDDPGVREATKCAVMIEEQIAKAVPYKAETVEEVHLAGIGQHLRFVVEQYVGSVVRCGQ